MQVIRTAGYQVNEQRTEDERQKARFSMLHTSAFAVIPSPRLRRNQLPSSLFNFAGGYVETSYDGRDVGQAILEAGYEILFMDGRR